MLIKIFSAVVGIVAFVAVKNWLDDHIWLALAIVGGIAAGLIVYGMLVDLLSGSKTRR